MRAAAVLGVVLLLPGTAWAYGPQGHLIAGRAAEDRLCPRAADEIALLADGEDLGEIGLWADRIRSDESYADSAAWHYMNIGDRERLTGYMHPAEGDVLWAIGHFAARLGDSSLTREQRGEALRFLVHFIVDLHQPLHVGRADDRGGNTIDLEFGGESTNLHRLWDTQLIEWDGRTIDEHVRSIRSENLSVDGIGSGDPVDWARESFVLRPQVYDFESGRPLSRAYLDAGAATTHERLRLAALRLAGTLNDLLCE